MLARAAFIIAGSLAAVDFADAAIIPSWRINIIPENVASSDPFLSDAASIQLVVTLTGESLFNVASLQMSEDTFGSAHPFTLFNHPAGGSGPPNTWFFAIFPSLEYDTYVCTSDGLTAVGALPVLPVLGPNAFHVAWGAVPPSGPPGGIELKIAQLSFVNAGLGFSSVLTPVEGEVRDNLNPNVSVPIPPMPTPLRYVPEPTVLTAAAALAMILTRRR